MQIARQEQLNILQPLIYDDAKLGETMKTNHLVSRYSNGLLSPRYAVVYSAGPATHDSTLTSVFDKPTGKTDWITGPKYNLANPDDRMAYVGQIADDFSRLMASKRGYLEAELEKIRGWLNA